MRNIQISPLTKTTKLTSASYLFSFISACWERNEIMEEVILVTSNLWAQTDFGGKIKIIQVYECYDVANKRQIEQHWLSYSSNCSIFRAKKLETISVTKKQQNLKNGEARFCLNIDVRKEMEDSRLNAINKQLITFVKGRLNFSCKSTTAANVDLTASLLDNWLKNNHITR